MVADEDCVHGLEGQGPPAPQRWKSPGKWREIWKIDAGHLSFE